MKTLVLKGGFHNAPEIRIKIKNEKAVESFQRGDTPLYDILTNYQDSKLRKHFCGIKSCTCGSYMRAEVEVL